MVIFPNNKLTSTVIFIYCCLASTVLYADEYQMARQRMVEIISKNVKETSLYLNKQELDPRVMEAIGTVPRHEFVPEYERDQAYLNRPLSIGHGQTISQPYIVAIMTDMLKLTPESKVLELGTGSGYQAAILSELAAQVYTIEIVTTLGDQAREKLKKLGYDNVQVKTGDGYYGWEEYAPFDAIIVTAAGSHIPPPLIKQLKPGGHMVSPVGTNFMTQQLLLISKEDSDKFVSREIIPVSFVPLTGKH